MRARQFKAGPAALDEFEYINVGCMLCERREALKLQLCQQLGDAVRL